MPIVQNSKKLKKKNVFIKKLPLIAWGYNWATLFLGDINMGTWPFRLGGVSDLKQ
jgi:hypothetical protein